jgi:hypothetical protein
VTSATPASAIISVAAAAFLSVMPPRQKPWLIVTLPPKSPGAGTDLLDIEEAHLARLVQVDVEPDTMPRGDGEDTVELALGIAIDLQRVDAADQIGPAAAFRGKTSDSEDMGNVRFVELAPP